MAGMVYGIELVRARGGGRKADALAYVTDYISRRRTSPSLEEISKHLRVSKSRVRALLAQLAADGAIERAIGTQRAIVVPGLMAQIAIEQLRSEGWVINEDLREARFAAPLPHDNLSLVAIIEHIPGPKHGDQHETDTGA